MNFQSCSISHWEIESRVFVSMLARSSSTPISTSLIFPSSESSPPVELPAPIARTRSICLTASSCSIERSYSKITRASSENDLKNYVVQKNKFNTKLNGFPSPCLKDLEERTDSRNSLNRLFSSSGLDEECEIEEKNNGVQTAVVGGGVEDGGGRVSGGGGNGGSGRDDGRKGSWFYGNDGLEDYYLKMIEANPGSPLFLGNYAKFLKEVRGEDKKAEKYCARAILENPNDGSMLSFYAELLWEREKDASRAERYHHQAVQAAPDDSYVLASYARFLWDTEEEEEESASTRTNSSSPPPPPYWKYFGAVSPAPCPVTASS